MCLLRVLWTSNPTMQCMAPASSAAARAAAIGWRHALTAGWRSGVAPSAAPTSRRCVSCAATLPTARRWIASTELTVRGLHIDALLAHASLPRTVGATAARLGSVRAIMPVSRRMATTSRPRARRTAGMTAAALSKRPHTWKEAGGGASRVSSAGGRSGWLSPETLKVAGALVALFGSGIGVFMTVFRMETDLQREERQVMDIPLVPGNPLVYLDIMLNETKPRRMVIQLRKDVVPKTAENFRQLCTGEEGYGFTGTRFFKIEHDKFAQGGDFMTGSGRDSFSVYGGVFEDENFELAHIGPGILSMVPDPKKGKDSNGSQFTVSLRRMPDFDGQRVVFGNVVEGMDLVRELNQAVSTTSARNLFSNAKASIVHYDARIVASGQLGVVPEDAGGDAALQRDT